MRSRISLEGLSNFEHALKIVIIENNEIQWTYECMDSHSQYKISQKTKKSRFIALFSEKLQFIIETLPSDQVKTMVTVFGSFKMAPIILYRGLPCDNMDKKELSKLCKDSK